MPLDINKYINEKILEEEQNKKYKKIGSHIIVFILTILCIIIFSVILYS